jgi:tripartite-type tricarboxylate transporter receptor subunit TctC
MVLAAGALPASAQKYPVTPVKVIVPMAPGGGTDIMARALAKGLAENVGQAFVIENRAGGNATIGAAVAAKAKPDGQTLLLVSGGPFVVNQFSMKSLPYDPITDFTPISQFASMPMVLVVAPAFPANSPEALVEYLRAHPKEVNYAATDEMSHLGMVMIAEGTKTQLTAIQYKGGGPALIDLLGGHVQVMLSSLGAALPYLKDGRLRALAVTGKSRAEALPNVPTVSETILPGYELTAWFGVFGPANTPSEVVNFLNAEISKVVRSPQMRQQFASSGAVPVDMSAGEFASFVKSERDRLGKAFAQAGGTSQ